jgi:hypothetical protein
MMNLKQLARIKFIVHQNVVPNQQRKKLLKDIKFLNSNQELARKEDVLEAVIL